MNDPTSTRPTPRPRWQQALDIKRQIHYPKRYRETPRLPSCLNKVYADAAGWTGTTLGIERPDIYPTYAGAQTAAQELGIKTKLD